MSVVRTVIDMCVEVKVDVVYRNQVDRHVVAALYPFLEDEMIAKTFDAVVSLNGGLLGYNEVDIAVLKACDISSQQVISHEMKVLFPVCLHVFADYIRF